MIFSETIASWLPQATTLGVWNYWIMLAITFLESVPFVGLIIPGTFALIFVGFLGTTGAFDVGDMVWFAALGGILGDGCSYALGRVPTLRARVAKLFPQGALLPSEQFVETHGGKSIFFGRFIGPLRPFVPYLAGTFKMQPRVFLFWNVVSGFAWAGGYLALGYAFGEAWQKALLFSSRIGWATVGGATLLIALWGWKQWRKTQRAKYAHPPLV